MTLSCLSFFMNWDKICFLPTIINFSVSMHDLDISSVDFKIDSPQILSMRILIMSWSYPLLGSRFLIVLALLSLVNEIVEGRIFILFKLLIGSLLVLRALLSKKIIKDQSVPLKIFKKNVMINWWNARYIFCYLMVSILPSMPSRLVVGSTNLFEIGE